MNFDDVHNYYEKIVFDKLIMRLGTKASNQDYVQDIACIALNHLPPRYIRYEVDMIFYLSPIERSEIDEKIDQAIEDAIALVHENSMDSPKKTASR